MNHVFETMTPAHNLLEDAHDLLRECQDRLEASRDPTILPLGLRRLLISRSKLGRSDRGLERALHQHGRVVWGVIVRANRALYHTEESGDAMGSVVFYVEPSVPLSETMGLGDTIRQLRFTEQVPRGDAFLRFIRDDDGKARPFEARVRIPEGLAGAFSATFCDVVFHRAELPQGFIRRRFVPVVICPELTDLCVLLSLRHWPQELLTSWAGESGELLEDDQFAMNGLELEFEHLLGMARACLEGRAWEGAAKFGGLALSQDPNAPEAHALIETFARTCPDPSAYIQGQDDSNFHIDQVALESRLAWHQGDRDHALFALAALLHVVEDIRFLGWLIAWLPEIEDPLQTPNLARVLAEAYELLYQGAFIPEGPRAELLEVIAAMMARTENTDLLACAAAVVERLEGLGG